MKGKRKAMGKQKTVARPMRSGATKPQREPGDSVGYYYQFLEHLWEDKPDWGEPPTMTLRDYLFSLRSEAALRDALAEERIFIDPDVRIMLVDPENARIWKLGSIAPDNEPFYVLVLPPKPLDNNKQPLEKALLEEKAWDAAWYHARSYGYGM